MYMRVCIYTHTYIYTIRKSENHTTTVKNCQQYLQNLQHAYLFPNHSTPRMYLQKSAHMCAKTHGQVYRLNIQNMIFFTLNNIFNVQKWKNLKVNLKLNGLVRSPYNIWWDRVTMTVFQKHHKKGIRIHNAE